MEINELSDAQLRAAIDAMRAIYQELPTKQAFIAIELLDEFESAYFVARKLG